MSFDELYEAYFDTVYRYIVYMVSDPQLAEDFTQDVFLKVYKCNQLPAKPITYIRQTARHHVIDYYRRRALIQWLPFLKEHEQIATSHLPQDWLLANEGRAQLLTALHKLKPLQREIIIYRKIEELSIEETRQITGLSAIKIANTQRSAMQKLKQLLGGDTYA